MDMFRWRIMWRLATVQLYDEIRFRPVTSGAIKLSVALIGTIRSTSDSQTCSQLRSPPKIPTITMTCFAVAVIVTLAICGGAVHSSVIVPWTLGTAVLPPLSYTAQTLNLNGLQVGTVVAGQPARLVQVAVPATPTLLRTAPGLSLTQGSTVQVVGAPAALELTAEVPTDVEVLPVVPVLAPLLQAEG